MGFSLADRGIPPPSPELSGKDPAADRRFYGSDRIESIGPLRSGFG